MPRSYQVTPGILGRRRATQPKKVRPTADSMDSGQPAADREPSRPRRTPPPDAPRLSLTWMGLVSSAPLLLHECESRRARPGGGWTPARRPDRASVVEAWRCSLARTNGGARGGAATDWPRRSSAALSRGVSLLAIREMSLTQRPWADQIAADVGAEELRRPLVFAPMTRSPLPFCSPRSAAWRRGGVAAPTFNLSVYFSSPWAYPQPNG
jgi:hypothetical protein